METWKPVVGYEGLYEVSDHGRVKSLARKKGFCICKELILKYNHHPNGYLLVGLTTPDAKPLKAKVHRMVMEAFIGHSHLDVDHIDRNPKNNVLENLRYVTKRQNQHNTKRLKGYPCVTEKCGGYRAIKGFGTTALNLGTYECELDAHHVEVACTTYEKAQIANKMFKSQRRTPEQTTLILEALS